MSDDIVADDGANAPDSAAAEALLPLVYRELRDLAARKLARERPDQTLSATALVHEAYLRLTSGANGDAPWHDRGHFFAAAAEAMRRILIERARGRAREKRGGDWRRVDFERFDAAAAEGTPDLLVALDETLDRLLALDPIAGELVKLRYFAGLGLDQAADALDISTATAYRRWAFARAWLYGQLVGDA